MKIHEDLAPSDLLRGFGDLEGLRKLAIRLVRDEAEADDVVQESLLLGLRRATGRVLDLGSWLRGVVRNKAREARRAAARRETHEAETRPGKSPMQPIDIAERVEVHDQLVAAVKGLGEPYRSAVWLHYVEGREAADMARDLAIPLETVRTRLKRGVAKLREDLDRRNCGKRADWMPALALFAGVQPSASLLAATTTVAAGAGVAKVAAAAAALLVVAASAVLVIPRLLDRKDEAIVQPSRLERGQRTPSPQDRDAADPSAAKESSRDVAAPNREAREKIAPKPFTDEMAADSRGSAVEGTFAFHYQQGFTFASQTVSSDLENADVVFKSCAGGISSVTLEAPGGAISNLERLKSKFPSLKRADALARAVVKAEATAFGESATAQGDDRDPTSDAFLMRTRGGRWVVMGIAERRSDEGGWMEYPVTIRYAISDQPVFHTGSGDLMVDGIEIDSQMVARLDLALQEYADREREARLAPFKEKLAELDRRAAALEPSIQARDGAPVRVAAVLDRKFATPMGFHEAYVASTYSFEKATRDDVKATRNDWDFLLEQSNLRLNTVVDDQSLIWNLGAVPYRGGATTIEAAGPGGEGSKPSPGCLYAIHTIDSDTDQWALMRVEELVPNESLIFSWSIIPASSAVATAIEAKEETGESIMQSPVARLQIRGGAGGGNPFSVSLDGKLERTSALSPALLDLQKPLEIRERHVAYVAGGKVPIGKVFVVERVEYAARVEGDSNGDGLFVLWIGSQPLVCARASPRPESENWWYAMDRGRSGTTRDSMPLRGDINLAIPVPRGSESRVRVEISNSSWADVTLSGRLIPVAEAEKLGKTGLEGLGYLQTLKNIAEAEDETAVLNLGRRMTPEIASGIRAALDSIPGGAWRSRVSLALDQAPR